MWEVAVPHGGLENWNDRDLWWKQQMFCFFFWGGGASCLVGFCLLALCSRLPCPLGYALGLPEGMNIWGISRLGYRVHRQLRSCLGGSLTEVEVSPARLNSGMPRYTLCCSLSESAIQETWWDWTTVFFFCRGQPEGCSGKGTSLSGDRVHAKSSDGSLRKSKSHLLGLDKMSHLEGHWPVAKMAESAKCKIGKMQLS